MAVEKRDPEMKRRARELRKNMTEAEVLLWSLLRKLQLEGFKGRRQEVIGSYIVDFYCASAKLAVELDGSQHGTEVAKGYDDERTHALNGAGVRVIRFWNHDVFGNLTGVIDAIRSELSGRK